MVGKVTVWYMTEEERLAYIKKYPIVPIEPPKGSKFVKLSEKELSKKKAAKQKPKKAPKEKKKRPTLTDKLDKADIQKRYAAGEKLKDIAALHNISITLLDRLIRKERKLEPNKWPKRMNKRIMR